MKHRLLLPRLAFILAIVFTAAPNIFAEDHRYPWMDSVEGVETLAERFQPPPGFVSVEHESKTFGSWLRNLPMKPGRGIVRLYNGQARSIQNEHHGIIDLDVGSGDLQQCTDTVIRLRAEYLWSIGKADDIAFNFTSGDRCAWKDWRQGIRPHITGPRKQYVTFKRSAPPDDSRESFKAYLDTVFMYAGSWSYQKELSPVKNPSDVKVGDILIEGGFPGHVALVVGIAKREADGQLAYMLANGLTPAQSAYIVTNWAQPELGPWYLIDEERPPSTPEWPFRWEHLHRIKGG